MSQACSMAEKGRQRHQLMVDNAVYSDEVDTPYAQRALPEERKSPYLWRYPELFTPFSRCILGNLSFYSSDVLMLLMVTTSQRSVGYYTC